MPAPPVPTEGWLTTIADGTYWPAGKQYVRSGPGKGYRWFYSTTRPFDFKAWYIDYSTGDIWLGADIGMCKCIAYRIAGKTLGTFAPPDVL